MTLTTNFRVLLAVCAESMANGTDPEINLTLFGSYFWDKERGQETLIELAQLVEKYSDGKLTIRLADYSLFSVRVKGEVMYLAVCDSSTPNGMVTVFSDGMKLCILGPYAKGFSFVEPAPQEIVLKSQKERAQSERVNACRFVGQESLKSFTEMLSVRIRTQAEIEPDAVKREDFKYLSPITGHTMSLDDIATGCAILGIPFPELVRGYV